MIEWYTLDDQLRRDTVIEGFESFIWTERYSESGDFQIVIKSTFESRQLLVPDLMITRIGSTYVMKIDTVSDETDEDGTRNLTVTGRSLEALLDDRVGMPAITDTTTTPTWNLTGTPGDVVRNAFHTICVVGVLNANDTIPFYHSGTLLPAGNIPEESGEITVAASPDTLYNLFKTICDTYFLGFRFVRNAEAGQIYFEVYTGNDRTTDQIILNPVVFDPNMENLEKVSLLQSTALMKTVAYVFAQNGSAEVYAVGASVDDSGSKRRVLLINSSNSSEAGEELDAALVQEGTLALAAQRQIYAFDGELPQTIPYVYGRDYGLGDLVEERNSDGFGNQMIVTEQIFFANNEGERAYPTLTLKQVLTPGTWAVEDPDLDWNEVPDPEVWATFDL